MPKIWTVVGILALALVITPRFLPISPNEPVTTAKLPSIADQKQAVEDDLTPIVKKLLKYAQSRLPTNH